MHLTCKNTPIKPDRSHWMIRSEKPQVEVWLALDSAVKQQQKTQYDVSTSCDLNAPRSDTAGTEVCVQTSIQLISIASLAWLGNQPSRPLQLKRRLDKRLVKYSKLVHYNGKEPDKKKQFRQYISSDVPHTHTPTHARTHTHTHPWRKAAVPPRFTCFAQAFSARAVSRSSCAFSFAFFCWSSSLVSSILRHSAVIASAQAGS